MPLQRTPNIMTQLLIHFCLLFPEGRMDDLKQELELDVHIVEVEKLYERFHSKPTGLTTEQAKTNLEQYGLNALTPPPTTPEWVKFCQNLFGGFAMLLWVRMLCAFTISLVLNKLI